MKRRPVSEERRTKLRRAWTTERDAAQSARSRGDVKTEWHHLERAHIGSQPLAGLHVRTHGSMFAAAVRRRDRREVVGQAFRIVVAGPGSLTGRYPLGNTGGADVSAFAPMPVPDDLQAVLGDTIPEEQHEALDTPTGS